MPEALDEAVQWATTKLSKCLGDSKLLAVRLTSVRHQETLCSPPYIGYYVKSSSIIVG